jgi:hypothetical protein
MTQNDLERHKKPATKLQDAPTAVVDIQVFA